MKPDIDYTLYLCTDRNIMTTEDVYKRQGLSDLKEAD